jgi:hypothetical protein
MAGGDILGAPHQGGGGSGELYIKVNLATSGKREMDDNALATADKSKKGKLRQLTM